MRLKEKEIIAIVSSFSEVVSELYGELYLFGSRADDFKKGGDIDLLFITQKDNLLKYLDLKSKINSTIQSKIGEQRIDITIVSDLQMEQDDFLKSLTDKILLKKYA